METKVLTYREPKQQQSKSLTYYIQRIEDLQVDTTKIVSWNWQKIIFNIIILQVDHYWKKSKFKKITGPAKWIECQR